MEAALPAVLSRTAECAALLLIGYNLRNAQLFSVSDAEAAQRLAGYLTLPAVILQSCTSLPPVSWQVFLGTPVVLAAAAAAAGFMWYRFKGKHKRERAVLAGCSLGSDAPAIAIPLIEALAGPVGVVAACAATITNTFAVYGGSYLLFGSAGPAFPKSYKHDDGGTYRGEWRGMSKEGLGVYRYASGARYEGEWRNNVKDGRGVYYFPKGGTYEGEWSNGVMTGTGLRTYSNGKVSAGRWEDNKLLTPLELWQCATAAEGAAEAAMAAGR
eukprot:GHRR01032097.1.p1 GENE.GHRR01032097.1~~GHRR01032097.1.p1  ORF type:complete len:270 (+),score=89.06 GHRR01032097.1:113-922(+)